MSRRIAVAFFLVTGVLAAPQVRAELQQVSVGGQITILGEYYRHAYTSDSELRWPAWWLWGRPTGGAGNTIFSSYAWDDEAGESAYAAQWTRLHLSADFGDSVASFVELDSVQVWGEHFRSNYLTGLDGPAPAGDGFQIYQAFIDAGDLWGAPLRLRLGRQELSFGSEWLVGNNDYLFYPHIGLSFDAVRLTYAAETFSVDAWWSKLVENSGIEEDGDTDFSGVYASYTGFEGITLDAYWLWLRDALAIEDTDSGYLGSRVEDWAGVDDYETTNIHTAGLRAAGSAGHFDFEAEAAYQWGRAGQTGALFKPVFYGDNDAEYDSWSAHLDLGYTFETAWSPRLYASCAYLGGEDDREITFAKWVAALVNPFYRGSSVSFNRLFSDVTLSNLLDGTDLSNLRMYAAGASAAPSDKIECSVQICYLEVDAPFARPVVPLLGFLSRTNARDLGWEVYGDLTYNYSEDVYLSAGWAHLFVGDGLRQGHFSQANGLEFNGGSDSDDADYFFVEMGTSF